MLCNSHASARLCSTYLELADIRICQHKTEFFLYCRHVGAPDFSHDRSLRYSVFKEVELSFLAKSVHLLGGDNECNEPLPECKLVRVRRALPAYLNWPVISFMKLTDSGWGFWQNAEYSDISSGPWGMECQQEAKCARELVK